MAEYIGAHSPVAPAVEGRITKVEMALPITGDESPQEPAVSFVILLSVTVVALGVYAWRRVRLVKP